MDPFVAEISMVGFNFAPTGWATTNGQLLPIAQNTALFSLLGIQYGGDGRSSFALPDLQGSVPVCADFNQYTIGTSGGSLTPFPSTTDANPAAPITAFTLATTSVASPYITLNFIIALQGVFPPRT